MYSRKKGKAGSKKPLVKSPQSWLNYSKEEVEQLVIKFGKAGKSTSEIGITLRDNYGIPDVYKLTSKRVKTILNENKIEHKIPEDLSNLIKKEITILKHLEIGKKDMPSHRGLLLTNSKIKRLVKYYKRKGILPADWKYSRDQAKLTI